MRLSVLPNSGVPAYKQICEQITAQILSGEIEGGSPLPPIRLVAKEIGVSIITVRSAWDALEAEGLIVTRAGSGCYASELDPGRLEALRRKAVTEPLRAFTGTARNLGFGDSEIIALVAEELKK